MQGSLNRSVVVRVAGGEGIFHYLYTFTYLEPTVSHCLSMLQPNTRIYITPQLTDFYGASLFVFVL